MKPLIVGLGPANIEEIWQRIFRRNLRLGGRGIVSAVISAIDIALWDIKGKALGVPIYQLLGGPVRDHVPPYTHVQDASYAGVTPDAAAALAGETKAQGYRAIKTDPFEWAKATEGPFQGALLLERLTPAMIDKAVEWVAAIRQEVGSFASASGTTRTSSGKSTSTWALRYSWSVRSPSRLRTKGFFGKGDPQSNCLFGQHFVEKPR